MKFWQDKCAVFGIWNHPEASVLTYLGLYAQQHRGQEGAGIVSFDSDQHYVHKGLGLVGDVFNESNLSCLKGFSAIGHTRYSTRGRSHDEQNIQPLTATVHNKALTLAHNGNFTNFLSLKKRLTEEGFVFKGTGDTECLIHLIEKYSDEKSSFLKILKKSLSHIEGAYSLVLLTSDRLIAVRDPRGFRPLVLGRKALENGKVSYIVASETCAFDLLGAKYVREVVPGEILMFSKEGNSSVFMDVKEDRKACIFEHIYFSRPDSQVFGSSVYMNRKNMGRALALQKPVSADLVIPVPDSGVSSALGYAEASGIPFELGIIRNHYIGRTFIHPSPSIRNFRVRIKLNPQHSLIKGKSVVVVDDSLVRGTTSRIIVKFLRSAGAKKVHFRIASPPVTGPCYYGVDTPEKEQLIASKKSVDEIKEFLKVDSLEFLSVENLLKAVDPENKGYCQACFTGNYPTNIETGSA